MLKPKSKASAFFLSLALPGAGEYYLGSKKMSAIFFGTEALLWGSYFSLQAYGDMKKHDYRLFAKAHAGIDLVDKDHDYFVNIEHYDDIIAYNDEKLRQRDLDALYPEDDVHYWQWDNRDSRLEYEKIRVSSDKSYNRSSFVIGGIVINHIISAFDAFRIARKQGRLSEKKVHLGCVGLPEGGMRFFLCANL